MAIGAMVLVITFAAYIFRYYWWQLIRIRRYGTETDAVVSRMEETKRVSDGAEFPRRFYYVAFQRQDGYPNEARLLNPKGPLLIGDRVRIRYLDDRNEYAVLMKAGESFSPEDEDAFTGRRNV